MEELTVGAVVWTAQAEADLHELGRRAAQALHQEPSTWAPGPCEEVLSTTPSPTP